MLIIHRIRSDAIFLLSPPDEMISQILGDLFVAGSVTTATTLSWCWLYLAAYPEVQHRCQEEVTQVREISLGRCFICSNL